MRFLKNEKIVEITKVILVILFLSLALKWLIPTLSSEQAKNFVEGLGPFGPLIVIGYTILSHVLAPVAGTPGILLSITLFGLYQTMFYIYIASIMSAIINFFIARKFGRKWVTKLTGKKTMKEIDDFVQVFGTRILILSRIFGFSLFEVISYAAGLTKINFKNYLFITMIYTLVPNLTFTFIFRDTDFSSPTNLIIWIGTLVITGLIFTIFIKRYLNKKNNKE